MQRLIQDLLAYSRVGTKGRDLLDISSEEALQRALINLRGAIEESGALVLNLRVVAEGVETLEELAFLQAHQCDQAQGYYFSRPVVAPQFAELLETQCARSSLSPLDPFGRAARAASVNQG